MEKDEMKREFLEKYEEIICSNDERKMEVLGAMVKRVMNWLIENEPEKAQDCIDMLERAGYRNYLSEHEARSIVVRMNPEPQWSFEMLTDTVNRMGGKLEEMPYYNKWALLTDMCKIKSDHGETLREALMVGNNDLQLVELVYKMAVNELKDPDGVYDIRKYFDLC